MTGICETCGCRQDDLNEVMEFDHPVWVATDGTVHEHLTGVYAPELLMATTSDGQILAQHETDYTDQAKRQGWELLTGWTRQQSYRGLVMHPSEYVGGALERHIRETPGTYVVISVETDDGDEHGAGWAVAYKPPMNIDLDMAGNMFGHLSDDARTRLQAVVDHPSNGTWEDAHGIVLRDTGMGLTLWQAVIAVDPSFPQRGPAYTAGHTGHWDKIPTQALLQQAINYATR